jgi:hypothetical protein
MSERIIDPNESIDFMCRNAEKFAYAKAQRVYMEELRKTKKAELCKDALAKGFEAVNAQEREAYSDPTYKTHLEAIRDAVQEEEYLRWMLIAAQARVDVWRSQEASNRAIDKVTM